MNESSELPVPDEAFDGVFDLLEAGHVDMDALYAIVKPTVAAELLRWDIAAVTPITNTGENDYERGVQAGVRIAVERLRARAAALDPDRQAPRRGVLS